jgi:hypothetical protein
MEYASSDHSRSSLGAGITGAVLFIGAACFAEFTFPAFCLFSAGTLLMGAGTAAKLKTESVIRSIKSDPQKYIRERASEMFQDLIKSIEHNTVDRAFQNVQKGVEGDILKCTTAKWKLDTKVPRPHQKTWARQEIWK